VLESFPNPGVAFVELVSDEVTSLGPGNAQPDWYVVAIEYSPDELCLESKSLKLYLQQFRDQELYCESFAVRVRDDVAEALRLDRDRVSVTLEQKSRGGITITATA